MSEYCTDSRVGFWALGIEVKQKQQVVVLQNWLPTKKEEAESVSSLKQKHLDEYLKKPKCMGQGPTIGKWDSPNVYS